MKVRKNLPLLWLVLVKKHGPYNQYLSHPGTKIPLTTLKKWPEKSFATTSTSEDDVSLVTISNSNATWRRSSSIAIYYMETASADSSPSFLHQTDLSSERAFSEFPFNEYKADDDDSAQTFDFETHDQSDQSNLLESEEIITPTESEQGTICAGEDGQDGVEEYLEALISGESADDQNTDQEEKKFADVPLYDGAPISVAFSMLLIVTFAIQHSLTGLAIVDLLTLVNLHCALPNQYASSMGLLKKFFMRLKNPIQFHYCTFCMEYQGLSIPEDKLCRNRCCLKDLSKKEDNSYFIIIPLMCQLRDLIQS